MVFAIHQGKLEKKRPNFFKVAIRFHPNHPWPKAQIYSLSVLVELFYTKIGHYFVFSLFQP